ncbi:MAG: Na/Pi cotransporter family protein [Flavobacteriales bacterium]
MNFGFFEILTLVGSLGFFIYGMKIMSEGIQKLAGAKMRNVLGAITNNKFAGILTGFFTTSVIQSSSATTVMIVSFVNAGLLTLRQAIGVIMGANIGTTVTAFLVLGLGFGKLSLATYSLPLIALGLPLIFFKRDNLSSLGDFIIGFALLFMGLEALKSSVPSFDQGGFYNIIEPLTNHGIFSVIIFVFVGTIVTILVQSSSAAMALTLVMCTKGLPFEFAAAIVLGENIGTTITANIAAIIGNIYAKRAALAHLIFNLIGVLWMLVFFYFFTENIEYIVKTNSEWFPFDTSSEETIEGSTIQWSLALFHLTFNILNTLFLVWFIKNIENAVVKVISSKADDDEIFQLKYFSNSTLSSEFSILEVKSELLKFIGITSKMNSFLKALILETDKRKFSKILNKIRQYEEITDRIEDEVSEYLTKVNETVSTQKTNEEIKSILSIINDLESIGDIYYSLSKLLERKSENKIYFVPNQRNNIIEMINKVENLFNLLKNYIDNTNERSSKIIKTEKNNFKKFHNGLKKNHLMNISNSQYSIKSGVIYSDILSGMENVTSHIIEVKNSID